MLVLLFSSTSTNLVVCEPLSLVFSKALHQLVVDDRESFILVVNIFLSCLSLVQVLNDLFVSRK